MKVRQVWGAVLAVAMLAACNSRREAPAAAYGTEMLAGQVEVRGVPNASPAGVEVSVRGTGMAMTLTGSGEFLFAGVPVGAALDFHRPEDGIDASMTVDPRGGFLAVELTKTTATAKKSPSRRRGVGSTRETVYEFEGTIVTAAAGNLVLFTSRKVEQTIALAPETIIRKGQSPVAAAELAARMRVHVKAKKTGEAYTAVVVIVQNDGSGEEGEERPPATEYEGTVRSASATELVVFTSHREEKTFAITADTVVRKGNTSIRPEEIQAGWRVHVKATTSAGGTSTAARVTVQNTRKP